MAVNIKWLVVWFMVGVEFSVIQVEGDVEEVGGLLVGLSCDFQSKFFKEFYEVIS